MGATSSDNINFLTGLGHSVYMANFVEDAARPEWRVSPDTGYFRGSEDAKPGERSVFDIEMLSTANATFAGRAFDVIALWDALDYLPQESGWLPWLARLA